MADSDVESSLLTPTQRAYLREKQYKEESEGGVSESYARTIRSRLRKRIREGVKDFDIIFEHLSDDDLQRVFRDVGKASETTPERKKFSDIDPHEIPEYMTERERIQKFGQGEISEKELEEYIDGWGVVADTPEEYYQGVPEELRTDYFSHDETGEVDLDAVEDFRKQFEGVKREYVTDQRFHEGAKAMVALLFLGYRTDPQSWSANELFRALLVDGIERGLERQGLDQELEEIVLEIDTEGALVAEAHEKLKNGKKLHMNDVIRLQETGILPAEIRVEQPDGQPRRVRKNTDEK